MADPNARLLPTLRRFMVLLGCSFLIFAFFVWLGLPSGEPPDRARRSRMLSDMRTLAVALESYRIDNPAFPPVSLLHRLTTPIAYLTNLPEDVFASEPGTLLRYQRRGDGWIIGSFGPDRDDATGGDLRWDRPIDLYEPESPVPGAKLIPFTYDPSNGINSEGDLWRVHEPPATPTTYGYDPTNGASCDPGAWRVKE